MLLSRSCLFMETIRSWGSSSLWQREKRVKRDRERERETDRQTQREGDRKTERKVGRGVTQQQMGAAAATAAEAVARKQKLRK